MKVIVLGAGIGGLTAAHELAKLGIEVVVYERNDCVGGLARSTYHHQDHFTYPVEYSWRVYGTGYKNLQRVLKEIPLRENKSKSIFNNLLRVATYIFPRFDRKEVILSPQHKTKGTAWDLSWREKLEMLDKILCCVMMSTERMDSMDHLKWKDFCEGLSPEAKKFMVRMWGPVLGMDPSYMSFPVVARIVGVVFGGFINAADGLYLMKKPTNEAWFDEWSAYLEELGTSIHLNHELREIEVKDGKVTGVQVYDSTQGKGVADSADFYVLGVSVEALANMVEQHPDLSAIPELQKSIPLAQTARQVQLSVQIFLDQPVVYPTQEPPILYLSDSPWAIIIEPQDVVWGRTYSTDPKVKAVWSVGICQTDVPGIFIQKPFTECTPEEIHQEVWAQIKKSYAQANIKMENGDQVTEAHEVLFYMWDSFKYNPQTKRVEVWEPKFSNNAGGLQYQPSNTTSVPNLLFATGYTKTNRFIYSMESAAEAGTACANIILDQLGRGSEKTKIYPFKLPLGLFKPLIWLDRALFKLGLPYLGKIFSNSVVVTAVYFFSMLLLLGFLIWCVVGLISLTV